MWGEETLYGVLYVGGLGCGEGCLAVGCVSPIGFISEYLLMCTAVCVCPYSFGHMTNPERRKEARPEDLAKAALVTVTNNIGAIARMCASISVCVGREGREGGVMVAVVSVDHCLIPPSLQGVERVIFVGNYLCGNEMSIKMLAYAMEYWSQGTIKALFLQHEGYFGALGCLLTRLERISNT